MTTPAHSIIAVVDDDQRILVSLGNLLESADYAVRLFPSATALLESGCLAEIDCLVSDIGLPAVNGIELVRLVQIVRPGLPTIFITGHSDALNRLPTIGLGQYCLFKKPFDGQEVLIAINSALRGRRLLTTEG
jgi:FixJ family two-component response regulator